MKTYRVEAYRGEETFTAERVAEDKVNNFVAKLYEAGWTDAILVMNNDDEEDALLILEGGTQ